MPCPDVARWVSAARPGGGETAAARLRAGLHAGNFDNHFILAVFKATFVNVLILIVAISR